MKEKYEILNNAIIDSQANVFVFGWNKKAVM